MPPPGWYTPPHNGKRREWRAMGQLEQLRTEAEEITRWRWEHSREIEQQIERLQADLKRTHLDADKMLLKIHRRIQAIEPTPLPEPTPITPVSAPKKRERKPLSREAALDKAREALRLANEALDG